MLGMLPNASDIKYNLALNSQGDDRPKVQIG